MNHTLPTALEVGGRLYGIDTDYRAALDAIEAMNDPDLSDGEKAMVALYMLYDDPEAASGAGLSEALERCVWYLNGGEEGEGRKGPRLMDWQQDAPLIAAGISKAAGQDVRTLPYLHWWSFLAWFDAIGEGSFATVVAIRDKLRRGKRLENWELDYYRTHRAVVELRGVESAEEQAEKRRLLALLGGQG